MNQNNHHIWYLPLYFFLFFSCYTLLKFIFIFFFMSAYTPSFLFDFTFFYAFSGLDHTQLLFIGMMILLVELSVHIRLSKKYLLFSFPLTLFLLGGIGLRVATSPISLIYIFHYIVFALLLLVLIVDHRLYLFIPADLDITDKKTKIELEKISLPSFGSVHPEPTTTTSKIRSTSSTFFKTFSQSLSDIKQSLTSKLNKSIPQPTGAAAQSSQQDISPSYIPSEDYTEHEDEPPFVHPVERQAEKIPTTKKLLSTLESRSFDHLDSKIDRTKLEEQSFLDSYLDTSDQPINEPLPVDKSLIESIVQKIDESAVVITRGTVKAVNTKFSSLVNRPMSDIMNHDFVNFLAPEAFSDFKSHCSQRLAGESSKSFPVVLLTKKHKKIRMKATVKPVNIHGEQVEITIFQELNT